MTMEEFGMKHPIRLDPQCVKCLLDKHLTAYPQDTPQALRVAYMQRLLRIVADAPACWGAPVLVGQIKQLREELFGEREDFSAVKTYFNRLMLEREGEIEDRIAAADDPLKTALCYAMIGNYIDFGAMKHVDEGELAALLDAPERFAPDPGEYAALKEALAKAGHVAYLTDNCGEIVFDKLLIRTMMQMYPGAAVTVIVRGAPTLNDATIEDARQVGMDVIARVIGNGSGVAGTHWDELSEEARGALFGADVILAKGQANHETMRHCGMNVFYIFLCKCHLFADRFGVERFSGMLIHDSRC